MDDVRDQIREAIRRGRMEWSRFDNKVNQMRKNPSESGLEDYLVDSVETLFLKLKGQQPCDMEEIIKKVEIALDLATINVNRLNKENSELKFAAEAINKALSNFCRVWVK